MRESVKASKIHNEFNQVATSNQVAHLDEAIILADLSALTIGESPIGDTERVDKTADQLLKDASAKRES
ncbi:hypothetical protein [Peribacillus butanolivorans]|uniref:hypothetical protein n=1 Tax=Peribacillus butanolivorans TaxID=421767 RepID=UPI00366F3C00